jgi:hypothetical protein
MTAAAIADSLHARPVGAGRWIAKCPAHEDGSPSLSLKESGGRILIYCRAGCTTPTVLKAAGLSFRDLFGGGPPPSPTQAQMATVERLSRETQERERRADSRAVCDRVRRLRAVADELVLRLAHAPDDDPASNAIAKLFRRTVEMLRSAEAETWAIR